MLGRFREVIEHGGHSAFLVGNACESQTHLNAGDRADQHEIVEVAKVADPDLVGMLLEADADTNVANEDGQTPLMLVARTGNVGVAKALLDHGADVNRREKYRDQSAVMWAAAEGQAAMVKELVAHGANVNAKSKVTNWDRGTTAEGTGLGAKFMPAGGLTALLFAARQGHLDCAQALVEAGADKDQRDPDGISPMVTAIVNALVAADAVLIPLHCEYFALEGLADLINTIGRVNGALNPSLTIEGLLLTMYDERTNLGQQVAKDVRGFFTEIVFRTVIPRNVRLGEAPSHGLPVLVYDGKSRGAEAYQALAQEMIERGAATAACGAS